MSIAFRASANVVNGTAGTTVVVSKPAGTADGDVLVAYIARNGTTGPSGVPAGWTLVGTAANPSNPTLAAYYKVASGEPASWTWTITSSVNWGWVGAYTGVDTGNPIAGSVSAVQGAATVYLPGAVALPRFAMGVSAAATIRAATGVATTWTPSGTERADMSTNVGAGTDIAGEVQETLNPLDHDLSAGGFQPFLTASQSQTQGASWAIVLNAYFALPKVGDLVPVIVEAAFGADLEADPTTWIWTDITSRAKASTIVITRGRQDETSQTAASTLSLRLDDTDGALTPFNANSPWYLLWGEGTPIRAKQHHALADFLRFQGYVSTVDPDWPSGNSTIAFVDVVAFGRLASIQTSTPVVSTMTQGIAAAVGGTPPMLYYPFEEGSSATSAAEHFGGPALVSHGGSVTWATDSTIPGSAPLPHLGTGTYFSAVVPSYTNTGSWRVEFVCSIPSVPTADANLLLWLTTGGTGNLWKVRFKIVDSTIRLESLGAAGELLGDTGVSATGLYGKPLFIVVNAQQAGGSINWQMDIFQTDGSGNGTLGTTAAFTLGTLSRSFVQTSSLLDGMLFGHWALSRASDPFSFGSFTPFDQVFLSGHTNEDATGRVIRVADENGFTQDLPTVHNSPLHYMGPQPIAAPMTILREAESVENGIMCDGLGPGITWLPLGGRYNAPVRLALDVNQGHVKLPFQPRSDSQRAVDDVTVSRTNGSSGRFTVAPGRNPQPVTINSLDDTVLVDQAAFRVALGQVKELRAPTIRIDLRDKPELIPQWLKCDVGSRFTMANPPTQFGPNGLDQIIEYYREEFDGTYHTVDITSFPFAPFRAMVVADPLLGRLETGGSRLAAAATTSATSLTVAGTVEPYWTTTAAFPADFPHSADLEGEQITVTAVASAVTDTFTRSTSNGWGTATSGQAWTVTGGAASDYSTSGSAGVQSLGTVNVRRASQLGSLSTPDIDVTVGSVTLSALPTGANSDMGVIARYVDDNNYVDARVIATTSNTMLVVLRQRVASVETLSGFILVPGTATTAMALRFQALGGTLRAKAWAAAGAEPRAWTVTLATTWLTAGPLLLTSLLEGGNTNALPVTATWDNLTAPNPQTFTVTRSTNGVVKAHNALAPVKLWKPAGLAL